jgi:uncharacterized protein (TIGR02001 family)
MKKLHASLTAAALAMATSGTALAEVSANIGVTSNYIWRGVTQTDDGAAVQGGIDYAHDMGFYLGTWASNIKWGPDMSSGAEVDFYGGFANEYNDFGYDLGLIYYYYPDSDYSDSNFYEIYGSGSWKWLELGLAYTLGGDADNDAPFSSGDLYYYGAVSFDLANDWSIGGTVGRYAFDTSRTWRVVENDAENPSYNYGQLDIGKGAGDFGDFTFSVSKAGKASGDDDTKFWVAWAKTF